MKISDNIVKGYSGTWGLVLVATISVVCTICKLSPSNNFQNNTEKLVDDVYNSSKSIQTFNLSSVNLVFIVIAVLLYKVLSNAMARTEEVGMSQVSQ